MSQLAFKSLTFDLQDSILSYLPPETYPAINKSTRASVKWLQESSHYNELFGMARDTFLGRTFYRAPKNSDVVRRVRMIAIGRLNEDKFILRNSDWEALKLNGNAKISDLTYAKMNEIYERIQGRKQISSFEWLSREHGHIRELFELSIFDRFEDKLNKIKEWILTTDIPMVQFVLTEAGRQLNAGVVDMILQSGREFSIRTLNYILECAGINDHRELAQVVLRSGREVNLLLLIGSEKLVDLMIHSDQWRWTSPMQAGVILIKTIEHRGNEKVSIKVLNAIHSVDPRELGRALLRAISSDVPRVAEAILDSKHLIDEESLCEVYRKAFLYHRMHSLIAKKILSRISIKQRFIQTMLTPIHFFGFTEISTDFRYDL